ncbi:photosynthetic complex assembly protein PuhC [Polynucleobacter bastaniensis]|jgi:putative photosynthetic complex assembly protein|uniref:photosynthetic complex assembly protein PuhC n=1 Tax=Polynucleobacter bastaniensis TaxID=2081039 RepID=UPI001C0BE768|nr:photosynthetic complex assembly protein PuhC [Polynucleobacter bastaniensis]MBU3597749.1 photosynthetic complex assembly protein PuhC [Polynucleobacter bastaniensis]
MILRMNPIRIQNYIALFVVTVLVGIILLVANAVQSGKSETQADASVIAKKTLYFRDLPDGSVGVISASSGKMIAQVEGQAGFVRGILRALARERRIQQITSDDAFELMSRSDGRLTLVDLATGNRIDLESFGRDNAAQFAAFLNSAGQ